MYISLSIPVPHFHRPPREREIPPRGPPKWGQNGGLEGSRGCPNRSLYRSRFWYDFKCHLTPLPPPLRALENHENPVQKWTQHRTLFGYGFQRHLDASGGHLASILDQIGVDFGPPGAVREISRNWARIVAGARFSRFRGCPKRSPKPQKTASPGNLAPGASRKAPGTILHKFCIHFGLHFRPQNRLEKASKIDETWV